MKQRILFSCLVLCLTRLAAPAEVQLPRVIDSNNVVSTVEVPQPEALRFGWHEKATPNLCNRAGLPAGPFRTDRSVR